jgi:hypothetical protein
MLVSCPSQVRVIHLSKDLMVGSGQLEFRLIQASSGTYVVLIVKYGTWRIISKGIPKASQRVCAP